MVSIYSDESELKTFGQEPDVGRLENYFHKNYPNANLRLAYESGFFRRCWYVNLYLPTAHRQHQYLFPCFFSPLHLPGVLQDGQ